MRKEIGKIQKVEFGLGGYQDAEIGFSFTLGSDKECWGVYDFKGTWAINRSETAKWTEQERLIILGEHCMFVNKLLKDAQVESLSDLQGIPIEAEFEGMSLSKWRILTEVI